MNTTPATTNTNGAAVSTFNPEALANIIQSAPNAIAMNKSSHDKALAAGEIILAKIKSGMTDELDSECNDFLVKLRKTLAAMDERRKPITQIFDLVKKEFTSIENDIDPKNKTGIYFLIQQSRDEYATKRAEEKRRADAELSRKLAAEKEKINLAAEIDLQLRAWFRSYLDERLKILNMFYSEITLENHGLQKQNIDAFPTSYPFEHFERFKPNVVTYSMTRDELSNLVTNIKPGKYDEFKNEFAQSIIVLRDDIKDKIPGRIIELREIERATGEAKQRMELEAEQRRIAEEQRLKDEAEKKRRDDETKVEQRRVEKTTGVLFDLSPDASVTSENNAQVRESFEIEVFNPLGFLLIAQFYFEHEGKDEAVEKLEKKTLGSMKTFCEKYAMKHDVKIQSAFLNYKERFKTVAAA